MPSCPDCLRSWDNRRHHSGLDWRLALDMLDLAAGEPLAMQRWMPLGLGLAEKVRDNVLAGWPISSRRCSMSPSFGTSHAPSSSGIRCGGEALATRQSCRRR